MGSNEKKITVSVGMITFRHEVYIQQAIESILMQQTDFCFELIISDDCSPDKTPEIVETIIKNHPNGYRIKYFRHKENIGMQENGLFTFNQCKGKYIAICEGDDYWTDSLKLQKQVDFLEAHQEYSICWTKYLIKNESEGILTKPDWLTQIEKDKDISIDLSTIFVPYCTYTLTVLFRRESLDLSLLKTLKYSKDNSLYTLCLSRGKGMLMDFFSSVYRMHEGGVYSNASVFNQKYYSYLNLKEIVYRIPSCDNPNIRNVRNYLLWESIKLHPNHFSFNYLNLIIDRFVFLGVKGNIILVYRKLKKHIKSGN